MNNLENKRAFIIHFLYLAIWVGLIYFGLKYLMPFFVPFFIAYFIAFLLKPLINLINKKLTIDRRVVAIVILTLFYLIIGSLIVLLVMRMGGWAGRWFSNLPGYYENTIEPTLERVGTTLTSLSPQVPSGGPEPLLALGETLTNALSSIISAISSGVVNFITGFASQVPLFLVAFVITIISSYFFTIDYNRISSFILRQMSSEVRRRFLIIKDFIINVLFKFGRAYLLIISITFVEVSIGLLILGVKYPFAIALVTALVDILPVLGTGTIMIPWAVFSLINGNYFLGIGLIILYAAITIIRQTLEPRIVGRQIGLYPLLTLICMFVGARVFGIWGLFGFPITLVVLIHLNRRGEIHLFKE
ncbi:sporulation integral membrane protein YtvI [Ruminococcaceae bacterium OttesenSCG-928-I18]|nr:sporulation integral membrane protein YtvI [Ruminococcaceae bacterium OttesenSCG-928-I18]